MVHGQACRGPGHQQDPNIVALVDEWESEGEIRVKLTVGIMQKPDEVYKDMARVPEIYRIDIRGLLIPEGRICKVTTGGRSVLLSLRGNAFDSSPTIQIDERTRKALGLTNASSANFEFRRVCWLGQFLWAWDASDPAYRIAARFGVVSLILSFVGVLLGLLGLAIVLFSN